MEVDSDEGTKRIPSKKFLGVNLKRLYDANLITEGTPLELNAYGKHQTATLNEKAEIVLDDHKNRKFTRPSAWLHYAAERTVTRSGWNAITIRGTTTTLFSLKEEFLSGDIDPLDSKEEEDEVGLPILSLFDDRVDFNVRFALMKEMPWQNL